MFSTSLITVCLAGAATAFTPPGFEPSSTQDLAVGFGSTAAMNGVNLQKAATNEAPQLGTAMKLTGTYTLMMVDADIPPKEAGGATSELLHWMQPGLVSAEAQSMVAGMKVFALENPKNVSALATYLPPNPPNKTPTSHRYIQLLLNTTELESTSNLTTLMKEAASRGNFDAAGVLKANGLTVLMGNSFNVTNADAAAAAGGANKASNSTGAGSAGASGGVGGAGGAAGTGVSARPGAATLTTDVLLSTRTPGAPSAVTSAPQSAAPQVTAAPAAAGPINSATLTFDALISTGGAQAPGGAAQATGTGVGTGGTGAASNGTTFAAGASSNGAGGSSVLLAALGAVVVGVVLL